MRLYFNELLLTHLFKIILFWHLSSILSRSYIRQYNRLIIACLGKLLCDVIIHVSHTLPTDLSVPSSISQREIKVEIGKTRNCVKNIKDDRHYNQLKTSSKRQDIVSYQHMALGQSAFRIDKC
jgi:hypothetical protein